MKPPWWFCTGWWSPWCVLDEAVMRCRVQWICDRHDAVIARAWESEIDEAA